MRNRNNLLVGAPEVNASGGFQLGVANPDVSAYPESATVEADESLGLAAVGFIADDGVTKTVDRSTEKIKDWNGDTMKVVTSDHSVTLQATFCEAANAEVLKFLFGEDNVTVSQDSVVVDDTADELPHRCAWIDLRAAADSKVRLFAPDVQAIEVGEVQFIRSGLISYQVTMECFPDAKGVKIRQLIHRKDSAAAAAAVSGGVEDSGSGLDSGS